LVLIRLIYTNQRFNDLKVIRTDTDRQGWALCECKCGKLRSVMQSKLASGEITACTLWRNMEKRSSP
jgi:hypothetical protein